MLRMLRFAQGVLRLAQVLLRVLQACSGRAQARPGSARGCLPIARGLTHSSGLLTLEVKAAAAQVRGHNWNREKKISYFKLWRYSQAAGVSRIQNPLSLETAKKS